VPKGLFSSDVAEVLGKSDRWVRELAEKQGWPGRVMKNPATGRKQVRFFFERLPDAIKTAWAERKGESLPEAKPESEPKEDVPSFDSFTESERSRALDRKSVLDRFASSGISAPIFLDYFNTNDACRDLRERIGKTLSISTFDRWRKRYGVYGLPGLCDRHSLRDRGPGERTLSQVDKDILIARWLDLNRPTVKKVVDDMALLDGRKVSYGAALRFLNSLPEPLVILKREGKKKYNDLVSPHINRGYEDIKPMDWACSDHRTCDFFVVHQGRIFRPSVTVVADMRCRKPLGWYMDENPSTLTIMAALDMMEASFGFPDNILIDWGKDYCSKTLHGTTEEERVFEDGVTRIESREILGVFAEVGCTVHHSIPYRGQSKPIERFFRDMAERYDKSMPTYIGSDTTSKREDTKLYFGSFNGELKRTVTLTLEEARETFSNWVNQWSETHRHTGRGMKGKTPNEVFAELVEAKKRIPPQYRRLVFSEKLSARMVGRNGVVVDGLEYYSPDIFLRKKTRILVRRPVLDIGKVFVYDLAGRFLAEASNTVLSGQGITALDLKEVQKARKDEAERLRELHGKLKNLKKFLPDMAKHLLEHKYANHPSSAPVAERKVVGFELPPRVEQAAKRNELAALNSDGEKKPRRNIETLF